MVRAIAAGRDEIAERAARFRASIGRVTNGRLKTSIEDGASVIGGGSAPEVELPTVLVTLEHAEMSAASLEQKLRGYRIPVIARTEHDRVVIDLRTVAVHEESIVLDAIAALEDGATVSAVGQGSGSRLQSAKDIHS